MFVDSDSRLVRFAIFFDFNLASNSHLTSQKGYAILHAGNHKNANMFHHSIVKSKQITRRGLAAKSFAALHAFNFLSAMNTTINDLFHYVVPLVLCTDSNSLSDSVVRLN